MTAVGALPHDRTAALSVRRNLAGTLAVLACVVAVVVGLPVLDAVLPTERPLPANRALALGALPVTVIPPPGALLDARATSAQESTVRLLVDGVGYTVGAEVFDGTLEELTRQTREDVQKSQGVQIMDDVRDTTTYAGVAGREGGFSSTGEVGRYAVFVADGVAVRVFVTGPAPSLSRVSDALDASIASILIGRAS